YRHVHGNEHGKPEANHEHENGHESEAGSEVDGAFPEERIPGAFICFSQARPVYSTLDSEGRALPGASRCLRLSFSRCWISQAIQYYPKHYCGVFGVFGHPNAAELTYYGLYALQHRGQESAGIVTSDGKTFHAHKGMGLVSQVFKGDILHDMVGEIAVGHTRYSTTGSSHIRNAQPLTVDCARGQ